MGTSIRGTGSYLPEYILTSAELAGRLGIDEEWIVKKTQIHERRVVAEQETTSDLATRAADRALQAAGLSAIDLDVIVLATSTPDQPMPATACQVQANLGASRAAAFDVDAVCTGFVYALTVAHAMLVADPGLRHALVVGADTYSRILNWTDRRTCVLFGDGAGAVVLSKGSEGTGFLGSTLGSDGRKADYVGIQAGGSRRPASRGTVAAGEHFFAMQGRPVRDFAHEVFAKTVREVLKLVSWELDQVQTIIPHQANGVILTDLAKELALAPDQMHLTVSHYGNTGAASIPITLDDAVRNDLVRHGDNVVLIAFGGGMTWGGVALNWSRPGSCTWRNCA